MRDIRIRKWLTKRLTTRRTRGQALTELALILPVLLLLFASALDLGRLFYSQITIDNAAKEGALEAGRNLNQFDNTKPCDPDTNRVICLVVNEAKGSLYSIVPSDVTMTCSPSPCPSEPVVGDTVTVSVQGKFGLITPILAVFTGGQTITISASATAQLGVEPYPAPAVTPTPTPTPTATPAPTATPPGATPTPTPTATPAPTATFACVTPTVRGNIRVSPNGGISGDTSPPATMFTFDAPTVEDQTGCTFAYSWSFGDGANADVPSVDHFYARRGTGRFKDYTVTLTITTGGVPTPWSDSVSVVVNP